MPVFGVAIDYRESLVFYLAPPTLLLSFLQNKKKAFGLTNIALIFQIILILLFAISTLYSINLGGSYYYFWNFLIVIILANLANHYISRPVIFHYSIILVSAVYSVVFLLSKFNIIHIIQKDFGDNFILQVYGHSYLGNFLLIPIAITINKLSKKNIGMYLALIILFGFTLVLSQSRSGLLGAIVSVFFLKTKGIYQNTLQKTIFTVLIISLIGLATLSTLYSVTLKSADGSRLTYWKQALTGIKQSPIIGNGPNTFSVINRQQKAYSDANTNTTHNFVLDIFSNNGIIFAIILLVYLFYGIIYQYQKNNLFFSVAVGLFVSSLLDSFLSSSGLLTLFIIFATYGVPTYFEQNPRQAPKTNILIYILTTILFIYFVSKTGSDIAYFNKKYTLSVALDPFNLNARMELHDQQSVDKSLKLFSHDDSYLSSAIDNTSLPENEPLYLNILNINPQAYPQYFVQLGKYYNSQNRQEKLAKLLEKYNQTFLDAPRSPQEIEIAKLYYFLAISYWQKQDTLTAINLVKKSIFYSGGWSHFHVELANMYWHANQKTMAQQQLTTECSKYPASVKACTEYLSLGNFLTPGSKTFFNIVNGL